MPWFPKAVKRPLKINFTKGRKKFDGIILHVDAGASVSLFGWFSNPTARASSHFHVLFNGAVEQYVDTTSTSWTSRAGSSRTIGIETQGKGEGTWTKEQCETLSQIIAWAWVAEGKRWPLEAMKDSRPTSKGVGFHRLGIDPWRVQGGEVWGGRGKICPGPNRIPQIPGIIARAKVIAGEPATVTPPKAPPAAAKPPAAVGASKPATVATLRLGSKGNDVLLLQTRLKAHKVNGGNIAIDGSFGPATEAAVKTFQRAKKLTVDGVVGPATRKALGGM